MVALALPEKQRAMESVCLLVGIPYILVVSIQLWCWSTRETREIHVSHTYTIANKATLHQRKQKEACLREFCDNVLRKPWNIVFQPRCKHLPVALLLLPHQRHDSAMNRTYCVSAAHDAQTEVARAQG